MLDMDLEIVAEAVGGLDRVCFSSETPSAGLVTHVEPPLPPVNPSGDQPNTRIAQDTTPAYREVHRRLCQLIRTHKKKLRARDRVCSDTTAANKLFDLKALAQYNDLRLQLEEKVDKQKKQLRDAPSRLQPLIKAKLSHIKPSTDASNTIASRASKGIGYLRRLRQTCAHLLATGELLERSQGKGATHESLLSHYDVRFALREWVKGKLEVSEGGFEGPVSAFIIG